MQVDEVRSGGYFLSQGEFRAYFELGDHVKADVRIRCPADKVETFTGLAANQLVVIQEGKGVLKQAPFATASPAGLRPVQVPVDEPKGPLAVDDVPAVKELDFRPLGNSQ